MAGDRPLRRTASPAIAVPSMAGTVGQMATSTIDESALSKGQVRKLIADSLCVPSSTI